MHNDPVMTIAPQWPSCIFNCIYNRHHNEAHVLMFLIGLKELNEQTDKANQQVIIENIPQYNYWCVLQTLLSLLRESRRLFFLGEHSFQELTTAS